MKSHNKFLLNIVLDLGYVHDCLIKQDTYGAGYKLGALLNTIVNRINQEEKDEEIQDEECDEECEESEDKEDFETMYYEKCEEFIEQKENLIDFREENKKLKSHLQSAFELLRNLYNCDHIFSSEMETVRQYLLRNEEYVDGFDGRISKK